jgi:hypothetical protein
MAVSNWGVMVEGKAPVCGSDPGSVVVVVGATTLDSLTDAGVEFR